MRRFMIAGMLAMAAAGITGAAGAQQPTHPTHPAQDAVGEEYCVYAKLTDTLDYQVVAEAYLMGFEEDEAKALIKTAADSCIEEMSMSLNQAALASEVGIYGSVADYLADELVDLGVSEATITNLYDVVDDMSDADLDLLFEGGWRDDAPMKARMKAAAIAKGVPDKEDVLSSAYDMIEVSAHGMEAALAYLMADMADFDEDQT